MCIRDRFNATATDAVGNTSSATSNFAVISDTAAPVVTLGTITDDIGTVVGNLVSGARTDDTSLLLSGTTESGSTVKVYNGSELLGNATVSGTNWTYSATVVNGTTYQFNTTATDAAGNVSAATSNFTVISDTTVPELTLGTIADDVGSVVGNLSNWMRTDDTSLLLSGTTESGSIVKVYNGLVLLGNATVVGTTWTYSATVANGTTYQFNATATDAAGNTSVATSNFTVISDTAAPVVTLGTIADDIGTVMGDLVTGARTDDTSLLLSGTTESGSTVKVYNGLVFLGNATVSGTAWTYTATVVNGTT